MVSAPSLVARSVFCLWLFCSSPGSRAQEQAKQQQRYQRRALKRRACSTERRSSLSLAVPFVRLSFSTGSCSLWCSSLLCAVPCTQVHSCIVRCSPLGQAGCSPLHRELPLSTDPCSSRTLHAQPKSSSSAAIFFLPHIAYRLHLLSSIAVCFCE